MSEQPTSSQDQGRVIPFRPRGKPWHASLRRPRGSIPPVADLSKYERAKGDDDYRHRMTMNALALGITSVLVVVGIWLAVNIADMRKNQDCYLRGGSNCNQLLIPQADR